MEDPSGELIGFVGSIVDFTVLKQAEEKLKLSEERFRGIYEQSPIAIQTYDLEGNLVKINQKTLDLFGLTDERHVKGFNLWEDPNLSLENSNSLKNGEPVSISASFNFDLISGVIEFPSSRKGIIYLDMYVVPLLGEDEILGFLVHIIEITERKKLEEERQKFVLLAESSSDFIGMCDLDLTPFYVNPAGMEMVGLSDLEAACRVKVPDYFFPEDQHMIAEEFFPAVMKDGHGVVEVRLRHFKTGDAIWMSYYLYSILDENHEVIGWATVSRDITERKKAETALLKSKVRLYEAERIGNIGNWSYEVETAEIIWSDGMYHIYGRDPNKDKPSMDNLLSWIHEEDREKHNAYFERMLKVKPDEKLNDLEYRIIRSDGVIEWVKVNFESQFDEYGQISRFFGTVIQITDMKNATAQIKESEEKFRKLFQSTSLPLCYVDKDGVIILRNNRFISTFGYTEDEIPSLKEWWIKAYPDEKYREWVVQNWESAVDEASKTGKDIKSEVYDVNCKDGSIRNIIISGITIEDKFLATFMDITEQKKTEIALIESEEKFKGVFHNAHIGIAITDKNGALQDFNKELRFDKFANKKNDKVYKILIIVKPK